jgi:hypothetical protein
LLKEFFASRDDDASTGVACERGERRATASRE